MHFIADDLRNTNAWRVSEHAHVRAMAHRQLALSIPIVIAGFFAAAVFDIQRRPHN